MSASEIIQEIQRLPAVERQKVITALNRCLSPEELGVLAERMVNANDRREPQALAEESERGWYGGPAPAMRPHFSRQPFAGSRTGHRRQRAPTEALGRNAR